MKKDCIILIAEDDDDHFVITKNNFQRAGISNEIQRFKDGEEILNFLFDNEGKPKISQEKEFLLMLDVIMPKIDGVKVLEKIKNTESLKKMPVIMLTTVDDPDIVRQCHELGCSVYIVKPLQRDDFLDSARKVGSFLSVVETPKLGSD